MTGQRRLFARLARPGFVLLLTMALLATLVVATPSPASAEGSFTTIGQAECSGGSGAVAVTVTNDNDHSMPIWVRLRQGSVDLTDPHILFTVAANSAGAQELTGIPNGSYDVHVIWGSPFSGTAALLHSEARTFSCATTLATPTWRAPSVAPNSTNTSITASWNPVALRSSYHVQWSDDNIPLPVQTGITGTTDTLTIGDRLGTICAQVRAIGTGNNISSNYNSPRCTTVTRALATPNVDIPTISGSIATVTWDPVPNHSSYEVLWSLNNIDQPVRPRPKDATHNNIALTASSTGTLCAEVRAIGTGDYTDSDWQIKRCTNVGTKLATPPWRGSGVALNYSRLNANAYWYVDSRADRYEVTWFYEGTEIDPPTSTTGSWASFAVEGRVGEICAEVTAIGSGQYLSSDPSDQRCVEATLVFSEPIWNTRPIISSNNGDALTAIWSPPATPANFRPDRYKTQWYLDGRYIGYEYVSGQASEMEIDGRAGEFCVMVRAETSGNIRQSPYSNRECATVLAPPDVSITANASSASWDLVDRADGYTARWTYDGTLFNFDQLPDTATSSTSNVGSRFGEICVQVKSEGAGELVDSSYGPEQCRTITRNLQVPAWDDGVALDNASGLVTASWRQVSEANGYLVEWALGDDSWTTDINGRATTSTTETTANRTGNLCATVRATNSNPALVDSAPSSRQCAVIGGEMETPTWTSLSYDGRFDRLNGAWGSVDPRATYDIRWYEDREATPFLETTVNAASTQLDLQGRAGIICAQVRTAGLESRSASDYSASRCIHVRPQAPEWAAEPLTVAPNFDAPETVTANWLPIDDPDNYYMYWEIAGDRPGGYFTGTSATLVLGDRRGEVCARVWGRDGGVWSSPAEKVCIDVQPAADRQLEAPRATAAAVEAGQLVVKFDQVDNASGYQLRVYYGGAADSVHDATVSGTNTVDELRIPIDQSQNQGRACAAIVAIGGGTWEASEPGFRACADTTDYFTALGFDDAHDRMTVAEVQALVDGFEATAQVGSLVKSGIAATLTLEQLGSQDIGQILINNPTASQEARIDTIARSIGVDRMSTFLAHVHTSLRLRNPSYATYVELMTPVAYLGGSADLHEFSAQHFVSTGQEILGTTGVGLQVGETVYEIGSFRGAKVLSGLGLAVGGGSLLQEFAVGGLGDSAQDGFEIGAVVFGLLSGGTPLGLFFGGLAVISGLMSVFLPDRVIPPESTDPLNTVLDYLGEDPLVSPPLDQDRLMTSLNTMFERLEARTDTCGSTGCPDADSSEPSDQGVPNRPATRYLFQETDSYSNWTFAVAVTVFPGGVGDPPAFINYTNGCGANSLTQFPMIRKVLGMMRCS